MLLCHSSSRPTIYKEHFMLRPIIIFACTLLLTACSGFQFSSNLDKDNFNEYFKPSRVTVYDKSQLTDLNYTVVGAVEGSSCQEEEKDLPADIKQARTNARINAANINANGIVFQTCITFEADNSCISNIICYARALQVTLPEQE